MEVETEVTEPIKEAISPSIHISNELKSIFEKLGYSGKRTLKQDTNASTYINIPEVVVIECSL